MKVENNWFKKIEMRKIDVLCSKRYEEYEEKSFQVIFEVQTNVSDVIFALGFNNEEDQQNFFDKADADTAEKLFKGNDVFNF